MTKNQLIIKVCIDSLHERQYHMDKSNMFDDLHWFVNIVTQQEYDKEEKT